MSVIVVIRPEASIDNFLSHAEAEGMVIRRFASLERIFEITDREINDVQWDQIPEIQSVEAGSKTLKGNFTQSITFTNSWNGGNWGLVRHTRRESPWLQGARFPINSNIDIARDGTGVDIYIVDTGIEIAHPEFGGRASVVFEFNSTGGVGDDHGHGTACAACAAGTTVGFARGAQLWSAKVLNSNNLGNIVDILQGIDAVESHYNGRSATNRPAVMSISITGSSNSYDTAIGAAVNAGIVVVACAGNDASNLDGGYNSFPAEAPAVIAVGAIEAGDTPALFTNYGSRIDLLAAGVSVYPAHLRSVNPLGYAIWNGTSFSSPIVAGAIACVLQDYSRLSSLGQTQIVRNFIKENATWDRYKRDQRFEPMTPAILYLDPAANYELIPDIPLKPIPVSPTLVSGQIATNRGGGTLTLPAAPTVGNLMVIVVAGSYNTPLFARPQGFSRVGEYVSYDASANTGVGVFFRTVQAGDSNTITLPTSNIIATAYEFENAMAAYPIVGGSMRPFVAGNAFSLNTNKSPYGQYDAIVGAVADNQDHPLSVTNPEISVDYSNTTPAGSFGGAIFRIQGSLPLALTGTTPAAGLGSPVYGLFAIVSSSTPE